MKENRKTGLTLKISMIFLLLNKLITFRIVWVRFSSWYLTQFGIFSNRICVITSLHFILLHCIKMYYILLLVMIDTNHFFSFPFFFFFPFSSLLLTLSCSVINIYIYICRCICNTRQSLFTQEIDIGEKDHRSYYNWPLTSARQEE